MSFASAHDHEQCAALIKQGSKSFFTASMLLPRDIRTPAYALYAFCRMADDTVDEPDARLDGIEHLQYRLDLAYDRTPKDDFVDRAFADTVHQHAIPKELPEALIDGLRWDAEGRDYHTLSSLLDYAARVAAAVGAMMTLLMGKRDVVTLARACDLGLAMQLTNIARDVGEDARNGRLYLPQNWLKECGIDPEHFLAEPVLDDRLRAVIARLLSVADGYYERAEPGIARLPATCRPAICAASLIYREIGRKLEYLGHDSINHRAVVSKSRKVALLSQACVLSVALQEKHGMAPANETEFLVDAVQGMDWQEEPQRNAQERMDWLIDLFGRMKAKDMGAAAGVGMFSSDQQLR